MKQNKKQNLFNSTTHLSTTATSAGGRRPASQPQVNCSEHFFRFTLPDCVYTVLSPQYSNRQKQFECNLSTLYQYIVVARDSIGFFVPGLSVQRRVWSGEDVSEGRTQSKLAIRKCFLVTPFCQSRVPDLP